MFHPPWSDVANRPPERRPECSDGFSARQNADLETVRAASRDGDPGRTIFFGEDHRQAWKGGPRTAEPGQVRWPEPFPKKKPRNPPSIDRRPGLRCYRP